MIPAAPIVGVAKVRGPCGGKGEEMLYSYVDPAGVVAARQQMARAGVKSARVGYNHPCTMDAFVQVDVGRRGRQARAFRAFRGANPHLLIREGGLRLSFEGGA